MLFRNCVKPSGHYMYRTAVTIRTTNLTFSNSPFCPHSVFMCFVWIWEQTALIPLYSINWLVCINETECVYCAVRTGSVYIVQVNLSLCIVWCGDSSAMKIKAVPSPFPLWERRPLTLLEGKKHKCQQNQTKTCSWLRTGPETKYGFAGRQPNSKTCFALLCPALV
jgi:hypothetical protein